MKTQCKTCQKIYDFSKDEINICLFCSNPFGTFLINLRESLGISSKELAKKCGLSWDTVISFESGKRLPSDDAINKLSMALDYSKAVFIKMKEKSVKSLKLTETPNCFIKRII